MPRYDETFALLGGRVLREAVIDLETVVQRLASIGASVDAIAKALEDDLVNEGPIFNKFLRNLSGAASASVMGAVRQGEAVGLVRGNRFLQRAVANLGLEDSYIRAVEDADPEAAAEIEQQVVADQPFRWVAELVNTCYRCLPLHGHTQTMAEWQEAGLHPDVMHAGWDSTCHCRLVPEDIAENRAELLAPLKRQRETIEGGPKGYKKTSRQITQADMDKAIAARDAALQTPEGRRTLSLLGKADK